MSDLFLLSELFEKPISGEWGLDPEGATEEPVGVIRSTNFSSDLRFKKGSEIVKRVIDAKKVSKKRLQYGDIIIEKSGGSPSQPVGRVLFHEKDGLYLCNNFTSILRPRETVWPKYIAYNLCRLYEMGAVLKFQNKTTGIINLKLDRYLSSTKIPLPPLEEQRRIVEILDAAQGLIDQRKEQIALMDQLVQSLFYELFGDYFLAQDCYFPLDKVTKFIDYRGRTPLRVESGVPLINAKCVRRGYFNPSRIDFLEEETYQKIMTRGFPECNEVLFTTEGATMGFVARIPKGFSDGRFAVGQRLITLRCGDSLVPEYLDFVLNDGRFQSEVFKRATGSAAKGIRSKELALIQIPVAPFALQAEFASRVEKIEAQKAAMTASLSELEDTFNALMQRAFKGELGNVE